MAGAIFCTVAKAATGNVTFNRKTRIRNYLIEVLRGYNNFDLFKTIKNSHYLQIKTIREGKHVVSFGANAKNW